MNERTLIRDLIDAFEKIEIYTPGPEYGGVFERHEALLRIAKAHLHDTARTVTLTEEEFQTFLNMRDLQRRFFAGDRTVVGAAKALERRTDAILSKHSNNDPQSELEL